ISRHSSTQLSAAFRSSGCERNWASIRTGSPGLEPVRVIWPLGVSPGREQRLPSFIARPSRSRLLAPLVRGRAVRGREARVEPLAYLQHLLTTETVSAGEVGDGLEVVILSTRQTPVEHARRHVADVLEAVDDVSRDEDD